MKKFLYLKVQAGRGCDYTIGCGIDYDFIEAESKEEAIDQLMDLDPNWKNFDEGELDAACHYGELTYFSGDLYDRKLSTAILIECQDRIDLMPIFQNKMSEIKNHKKELENKAKAKEKSEREQYEKLKKKFS